MLQQKFVDLLARGSDVSLPVAERDVVLTYVLRILADAGLLYQFRQKPFDRDLVRTLAVLKLWLVGDTFNPDRFFTRLESGQYDWSDLVRLVRRSRRPGTGTVVTSCLDSYGFLRNLSPDESELAEDPHRRRDLYERIVQGLRQGG